MQGRIVFMGLLFALCSSVQAQNISDSLSATIEDSSGAVFPGLEITLANARTGFTRHLSADRTSSALGSNTFHVA